jgi:serine phosphatase RsbU (regulator of sigma subunit)
MDQLNPAELELHVGVAKVSKWATSESGDSLEMIERPQGGLSLVLADGQRSGKAAKRISSLVARKAVSLLAEGVRDGAAARASHDYLRAERQGQVSAELCIISLDLVTRTVVISRNSHCPVLLMQGTELTQLDDPSQAIGIYAGTKPMITEVPVAVDIWVVAFTDGVFAAGQRSGGSFDIGQFVRAFVVDSKGDAPALADAILERASSLDQGRPEDDMSVLVLSLTPRQHDASHSTRRLTVRFPLPLF